MTKERRRGRKSLPQCGFGKMLLWYFVYFNNNVVVLNALAVAAKDKVCWRGCVLRIYFFKFHLPKTLL